MADVLDGLRTGSYEWRAAEEFARVVNDVPELWLKFFRPIDQKAVISSWNNLWLSIEQQLAAALDGADELSFVIRDNLLRLYCRIRTRDCQSSC